MISLAIWFLAPSASSVAQFEELNVYAAASLKESFEAIARHFESTHPQIRVRLEFGGSQDLAAQINQGAPADVFASASPKDLDRVAYDPATRRLFALNRLVVVSFGQGPQYSLETLAQAKNIVLAAPAVPAGHYAQDMLSAAARRLGSGWLASVRSHVVSQESDVRSVLTKVELGEADAGIVYASDALAGADKVTASPIPDEFQPAIRYPMAIVKGSKLAHDAMQFMHSVLDNQGQATLTSHGFRSPLDAAHAVAIETAKGTLHLKLPLSSALPQATVSAMGPGNARKLYSGVPVAYFFRNAEPTALMFEGADEYAVTIPFATLKASRAVLVPSVGPYLQVVTPGLKPNQWVGWLVSIKSTR